MLTKGEAKCLAIAEEIVAQALQPRKVLLLDEPLKGLDMCDSLMVLDLLQRLVKNEGYTVITSLGYTGGEIIPMFDSMLLLRNGTSIFAGPANAAMEFFLKSPYGFEQNFHTHYDNSPQNAIEFLIDIATEGPILAKVSVATFLFFYFP